MDGATFGAMVDVVLRAARIVLPSGVFPASVHIRDGRIRHVGGFDDVPRGCELVDVDDVAVLLPGLVDTHVHVNEPGRTQWEGFSSATRAAAAGGVTTLLDMPLNSVPPTTTVDGLAAKLAVAEGQCAVDVGFWGGAVPGNAGDMRALHEDGVFGFKGFLVDSGVPEFAALGDGDLDKAMSVCAELNVPLLVHAEVPGPIEAAAATAWGGGPARYGSYLASRPPSAEDEAIARLVTGARTSGCSVHVVHLSSAAAVETVRAAQAEGLPFTAETCPHYLTLAAEDVPDGATAFKCAPPIRERANADALWDGLGDGTLGLVVSDHSPCEPRLKQGDFATAWGGIASLQLGLPLVWTEARDRGHGLDDVARWMGAGPARLAGFARKGAIVEGADGDLVVFRPDTEFVVDAGTLQHRHPTTPYAGRRLRGVIEATYVRGVEVYRDGEFADVPGGRLLSRT